ncbi:MAG TPA: 50S ribosomal protein L11 methyltransferase [Candidatus Limnocylindria bacterium]|nr:50S ribosomal protein L11 methyltransferase [Candidatus Limnocylindria bacterium]
MRWLELTVEADVEAVEAVSEIFGRLGRGAAVQPTSLIRDPGDELHAREDPSAPYRITAHIPDDPDAPAAVERTEQALWHLQAFGLRPVGLLRVRSVDETEWTEGWKAGYAPQRIGRVLIVPSWLDVPPVDADDVILRLDPGMAFGTGLHPTTRGCLTLLQQLGPMPPRLLDVGSGSGILALAALRLGAERAVCLDTDPVAVEATQRNAAENGLADRVEVRRGSLFGDRTDTPFPLVLANLVAAVLVGLAGPLAAHTAPGGTLLAGGIIQSRAAEVTDALAAAGFAARSRLDDGEWVSLRLERLSA